jgi:hypothetical protein
MTCYQIEVTLIIRLSSKAVYDSEVAKGATQKLHFSYENDGHIRTYKILQSTSLVPSHVADKLHNYFKVVLRGQIQY